MSSVIDRHVGAAEARAAAARAQLLATVAEIRARTDPRPVIARETDHALTAGSALVDRASAAGQKRPWLTAIIATLVGLVLALFARHQSLEPGSSIEK